MIGSKNNFYKKHILLQYLYKLLLNKKNFLSCHNYKYWQYVKNLINFQYNNDYYESFLLEKLFMCTINAPSINLVNKIKNKLFTLKVDSYKIVFINGIFSFQFSDKNTGFWNIKNENGVLQYSLNDAINPDIFLYLTEFLSKKTTRIFLPYNKIEIKPLYIVHVNYGDVDEKKINMFNYRHYVNIENGAKGKIIECFFSISKNSHFTGSRMIISVNSNAYLEYNKLFSENDYSYHFSHNDIIINFNSHVISNYFVFGSKLIRHKTSVKLNGDNSNLYINSLLFRNKHNIGEICSYVEHNSLNCISNQLHKFIIQNKSYSIFNGNLKIAKHTFKNNANMINNNLLLNNKARVNSNPQLEIYTDYVKCSHGSTIGKIDKEQLFYLRTRGLNKIYAFKFLIYAFILSFLNELSYNFFLKNVVLNYLINLSL